MTERWPRAGQQTHLAAGAKASGVRADPLPTAWAVSAQERVLQQSLRHRGRGVGQDLVGVGRGAGPWGDGVWGGAGLRLRWPVFLGSASTPVPVDSAPQWGEHFLGIFPQGTLRHELLFPRALLFPGGGLRAQTVVQSVAAMKGPAGLRQHGGG